MGILDRYVARIFLSTLGLVLFFVLGVYVVIDILGRVDTVIEARETLREAGRSPLGILAEFYLRSLPFIYLRLAPFLTLIAATIAMIRLMRKNEITPMVAAGRSPTRIARPIFLCAAILSAVMLLTQEWIVPRHAQVRDRLEDLMDGELEAEVDDLAAIRDDLGNSYDVRAYFPRQRRIEGVLALRFRESSQAAGYGVLTVESATWRLEGPGGPGWYPTGAELIPASPEGGFAYPRQLPEDRPLPIALTLDQVRVEHLRRSREPSMSLSLSEAARIAGLYRDVPEPAVVFHQLLTWPLANLLLLVLGLPLVLRFRKRNLLFGIGSAMVLCAAYFAVTQICVNLGKRGEMRPALAVWLPVILFTSVAAGILDFQRGPRPRRTSPRAE